MAHFLPFLARLVGLSFRAQIRPAILVVSVLLLATDALESLNDSVAGKDGGGDRVSTADTDTTKLARWEDPRAQMADLMMPSTTATKAGENDHAQGSPSSVLAGGSVVKSRVKALSGTVNWAAPRRTKTRKLIGPQPVSEHDDVIKVVDDLGAPDPSRDVDLHGDHVNVVDDLGVPNAQHTAHDTHRRQDLDVSDDGRRARTAGTAEAQLNPAFRYTNVKTGVAKLMDFINDKWHPSLHHLRARAQEAVEKAEEYGPMLRRLERGYTKLTADSDGTLKKMQEVEQSRLNNVRTKLKPGGKMTSVSGNVP